ncbi:MAG TPA: FAD-dependent monooxygenase [Terriglobales bacterium]|nr:FAD-dependent monooxygenase [Terriglobales bacterium]
MKDWDLIVVGAGPAGTAAAITAARQGARVLLLERGAFPRHRVCGEFVSPESLGLLQEFARESPPLASLLDEAERIAQARVFLDGQVWEFPVRPAGASIPRFDLDAALWGLAQAAGADCRQATVTAAGQNGGFRVDTTAGSYHARALINASGRWSNLGPPERFAARSPKPRWLGVKAHFREPRPASSADLYFFRGGYCGVQPVAADRVNVCAMVRADAATTLEEVLKQHPSLAERSREWGPVMEPVATSPLLFGKPEARRGGLLLAGDAAGFVDPFVGDGISLALRGGVLAAQALAGFWSGEVTLEEAARRYERAYRIQLAPVYDAASHLRRLVALPRVLRSPALRLLKSNALARYFLRKTRAMLRA